MTTLLINLQATPLWEAERSMIVSKCIKCGTCYPERYLERADIKDGICAVCRGEGFE